MKNKRNILETYIAITLMGCVTLAVFLDEIFSLPKDKIVWISRFLVLYALFSLKMMDYCKKLGK